MGTITPTGVINLLKGVPLDNKYNETLYVASGTTEDAHVSTFLQSPYWDATDPYSHYNNHEYQRVNDGVLRLKAPISAVYNVNYMIFKNLGANVTYPDHWFFAFVNKVEYVNEQAVNIYYEIDVFQTYCLDWTLPNKTLIERTHVASDNIGEHTVAEPIDTGKLICQKREVKGYTGSGESGSEWFNDYKIIVFSMGSENTDENPLGHSYGGVYSGLQAHAFPCDSSGVGACNDFVQQLAGSGKSDAIIGATMCPQGFVPSNNDLSNKMVSAITVSFNTARPKTDNVYSLDGHKVINKKLLTAPYTCFEVDVQTDKGVYFYEWFGSTPQTTNSYNFNAKCSLTPNPEIIILPSAYDDASGYNQITHSLTMDGFPQCALPIDSYRAWLAQNSGNVNADYANKALGLVSGAATGALGTATGNPAAIISGLSTVISNGIGLGQSLHNNAIQEMQGSTARGSQGNSTASGTHQRAIIIRHLCVRKDYAKMIDDFFTRFGYAIGSIETPNLAVRKAFTYIKTNGMSIHGNIPSDDMKKINECFDRGITFFKALINVGDYSVDNTL